jgi:2-phospho-L-lactate guanylyltransferase
VNAGILPVKALGAAKSRLVSDLGHVGRKAVAEALFADALDLCRTADFISWFVVSDDAGVLRSAEDAGFAPVRDPGRGLNPALEAAIAVAMGAGAQTVAIVPADLPLATAGDLADMADTGATSDVVVVPAWRGGGTNGMLLGPPNALPMSFGDGSLGTHMTLAQDAGLRCSLLPLPGMALDIDTVDDVDEFLSDPSRSGTRTYEVLAGLRPTQA